MKLAMNHNQWKVTLAAVAALGLSGGSPAQGWAKDKEDKKIGYVVLAEQGHALQGTIVPIVRLILEHKEGFSDQSCDSLRMSNGQDPDIKKNDFIPRPRSATNEMPITVCEAKFPVSKQHQVAGTTWTVTDTSTSKQFTVQLPTVSLSPTMALVLGDSGCRDNDDQKCSDKEWPLPDPLAEQMADQLTTQNQPAVIIHVGDYKYRGKDTDLKKPHEQWENWKDDFFGPMSATKKGHNLFAMAPWVVTRGNHELCFAMGKNGTGWFYMLDPTSKLLAKDSDQVVKENSCHYLNVDIMTRPYRLDFDNNLTLVVTDTADLYTDTQSDDASVQKLVGWYQEMIANFKDSTRNAWMVTHVPVWAVMGDCCKTSFNDPTSQIALWNLPQKTLPKPFKLVLSGHRHLYTSLDVNPNDAQTRMLQMVVGNGGVELNNKDFMGCVEYDKYKQGNDSNNFTATVHGMSRFGFLVAKMQLDQNKAVTGWNLNTMALENTKGSDWGQFDTAEVCTYPVDLGKPACQVKNPKWFPKQCSACLKVAGPDLTDKCKDKDDDKKE
ncbi:MAG: metallophosphoesterase [Magnetococcus sp. YQC-5]